MYIASSDLPPCVGFTLGHLAMSQEETEAIQRAMGVKPAVNDGVRMADVPLADVPLAAGASELIPVECSFDVRLGEDGSIGVDILDVRILMSCNYS